MEKALLQIINEIRAKKELAAVANLEPEIHLRKDLGFDSLDLAELTVKVEDQFKIDIFENGVVDTIEEVMVQFNDK